MKALKWLVICFMILCFASTAIAKPAVGMGKALGRGKKAFAEDYELLHPVSLTKYLYLNDRGQQISSIPGVDPAIPEAWVTSSGSYNS